MLTLGKQVRNTMYILRSLSVRAQTHAKYNESSLFYSLRAQNTR